MAHHQSKGKGVNFVSVSPTVGLVAYASGDLIGGKLTITGLSLGEEWGGLIQSVSILDKAKQDANIDVVIFGHNPTGTTFTDNAAFDVADADLSKIIAVISLSSYADFSTNSLAQKTGLAIPFMTDTGNVLYAALVSRGAPTYVATTDVTLVLGAVTE